MDVEEVVCSKAVRATTINATLSSPDYASFISLINVESVSFNFSLDHSFFVSFPLAWAIHKSHPIQ